MKRFSLITLVATFATLALAGTASAQIEVYASTAGGAATDFVYGRANTVSLRGSLDPATGGETIKVRQVRVTDSCPTATGTNVTILSTFTAYVAPGTLPIVAAANNLYSGDRDSRLCIYAYYDSAPGGEANPNKSYSQDIHFRDPGGSVTWFDVASAVSPDLPYFSLIGSNELQSGEGISFVPVDTTCPETYVGGSGAMTFPAAATSSVIDYGQISVSTGFWRACAYFLGGPLAAQDTFSRAPKGGWKPKYALKKKIKIKSGKIALGSVKCPGPCTVMVKATNAKGKKLASGTASGIGKIAVGTKVTSAGRKAAKRHVKAKFIVTTVIDESTATKTVKLKLR
ncbi:MAG: hypothetical protein QM648_08060 [Solirubrobacterales bacterium]